MKKKVLIVEDDADMHKIYDEFLAEEYELTHVDSTREAITALKSTVFDLMILDVLLKRENSLPFYHSLRKELGYKDLKVLCITVLGRDIEEDFIKGDSYIRCLTKPFERENLLSTIASFLKK